MLGPVILITLCLVLLGLSIRLFLHGIRKTANEKVLGRLAAGQPQLAEEKPKWVGLERMFLRAGLGRPTERFGLWMSLWAVSIGLGYLLFDWVG